MPKPLLQVMITKSGKKAATYTGRCLGLVTSQQFHAFLANRKLLCKLTTVSTKSLATIGNIDEVLGYRLAVLIREIDHQQENRRKVLFTAPLDFFTEVRDGGRTVFANTVNKDEFIIMEEVNR
jgi:hypothetical protein